MVVASCKSPVLPPSRVPMKNIETNELANSIAKNQLEYKKFRTRVKTIYDNGKRKQQIIINISGNLSQRAKRHQRCQENNELLNKTRD